ncbi:dihydrodipicolinate synthase family protein [Pseudomonas sp. NBRC 111133]|uniref:dihydrodipicolinate synthase family protein n=1 Tax=Pseudomonas sp. NBRC 111133 TaxID=1661048 RepID=UPI00277D0FEC|nr:dihydrodipicolinate synthase family protein [Pseudomonas sp. NBRC 111133]
MTTPFDAQGKIDYAGFEALIERYIAAGVHGFVLSSGTGMHVYLSKDESKELVAFGSKIINGRPRVIAQTSALLADEVVERTRSPRSRLAVRSEICGFCSTTILMWS